MADTMTKYKAEQVLGLSGSYDFKVYTKAYRAAVKKNHPDMGGSPEKMIEVNAAKEYLATYFEDDKSAVITCSVSDSFASTTTSSTASTSSSEPKSGSNHSNRNPADDFMDAVKEACKSNGGVNDAPFTSCEYTSKPQCEWADEDWSAFMGFQPPASYDTRDYYVNKMASWIPDCGPLSGIKGHPADPDNVDVSEWSDEDWYFYWFVNARHPRTDGKVSVRKPVSHLYGPYAEREHAKHAPKYWETSQKYRRAAQGDWVNTPYGKVSVLGTEGYYTSKRSGWNGNVGVPFAYALCDDYVTWLEMNLEAQCEALRGKGTPVAAGKGPMGYGWTGLEFLDVEDRKLSWLGKLGIDGASMGSTAGSGQPWSVGFEDTWTRAREDNGNLTGKMAGAVFGDEASKRDDVPSGAPAWIKVLNGVVNHFPSRTLFWVLAGIYANATLAAGADSGQFTALMVLAALTLVNVVFPVLAPVRWMLRYVVDTALESWEKKNESAAKTT